MSDNTGLPKECEAVREDLSELALSLLSGQRRSTVLDHVESCQRCATELQQLSAAADEILHLAPEVEPSLGFEQRLAERLQSGISFGRPRSHRRRLGMLCAAAVLTIVLGFGLGATLMSNGNGGKSTSTMQLTSATLTSHGQDLGTVYISKGKKAMMFMTVDGGKRWDDVTCRLIMNNGTIEDVGTFKISDGYGAWGAVIKSKNPVRVAQLVAKNGKVMASANLSV